MMRIFICPVSGGAFPVQLGLLSELCLLGIRPDIIMGSSGGNIAGYLTLASGWNPDQIKEIAAKLNSTMFAVSWWPSILSFMPSWMIGYWKGSVYADGSGASDLFKSYLGSGLDQSRPVGNVSGLDQSRPVGPTLLGSVEMWVGTLNRQTGKGQVFCNRTRENAIIKPKELDLLSSFWSHDIMPLTYLDEDLDLISQVAMASASIPVLVPEKIINGNRYVDGGTQFSSPLTALQDRVRDFAEQGPLHIDYISSFDMQTTGPISYRSLYDNGTQTIGELVKSLCIQDRLVAIEILRSGYSSHRVRFAEYEGSQDSLRKVEEIRKESPLSVLELYPSRNDAIDLLNFKPADIIGLIEQTRKRYRLRFWWIA